MEPSSPVITGIGCVAGGRVGLDAVWDLLCSGATGRIAAPEVDWSAVLGRRVNDRTGLATKLAVLAAREARTASGDPDDAGEGTAVVFTPITLANHIAATAIGYVSEGRRPRAQMAGGLSVGAAAVQVAEEVGAAGPCWAIEAGCSSSSMAVIDAARLVRTGDTDVAYAGGADCQVNLESPDTPDLMALVFDAMRVRSSPEDCHPFDVERDGMFVAPGSAVLRLEAADAAASGGRPAMAQVLGGASTRGGKDFFAPEEDGASLSRAIEKACRVAGIAPDELRLVVAHGPGTRASDLAEARAVEAVAGPGVTATSVKGTIGHTTYAAGGMNVAVAAQAIATGTIPPTGGLRVQDPAISLDVVAGEPRAWEPGPVAALSLGLGGFNSCVIVAPARGG
jgi:3-oxoacyl-[acyl-carrier-protein] synthase II